ncbi:MAG: hypothetical protein IPO92_11525 [Saprospiraceae bacterium]|nr:hypothetical protein [Saprospiraceae bacterium]
MTGRCTILVILLSCCVCISSLTAQVTGVNYLLKYDTTSCQYNVNIIVMSGTATTSSQRTQFNAQVTLVIAATDSLEMGDDFMPLQSNQFYGGTVPMDWTISSTVFQPSAQPQSNFYSVIPTLSPTAQFNNLKPGDTIKLFSIIVYNKITKKELKNCGANVRFFRNYAGTYPDPNPDPQSNAPGMNGGDFNNGFTIGSVIEKYERNSKTITPPKPKVKYDNICSGNINIDLNARTNLCQVPLTYAWTGPNGYNSTFEDVLISPASSSNNGQYTIIVTDGLECKDTIKIDAALKPNGGADQQICGLTAATLVGGNPGTGTWEALPSNPAGVISVSPTSGGTATVNFTSNTSGTYSFIYKTSVCNDTMKVILSTGLTPGITGPNSICTGTTTTITASGGTNYSWNTGSFSDNITVGPGTYTVTVTDVSGCTGSAQKTISSFSLPTANISGTLSFCPGANTTLTASGGSTYTWSNTTNTAINVVTTAGTYTVTITDSNGCTDTESKVVTINTPPTASISGTLSFCTGANTTLTASGGTTYVWNNSVNTAINAVNAAGTYTVTVTDSNGCTDTESKVVTINTPPTASISGTLSFCTGSNTTLTASGGTTYAWSNSVNTAINAVNAAGTYTVTVTDANGCTDTESKVVTINTPPTASINGTLSFCTGANTTLTASGGTSYVWSNL